jgi:hypothetical protein
MRGKNGRFQPLNSEWVEDLRIKLEAVQRANRLGPQEGLILDRVLEDIKFIVGSGD